MDRTVARFSNHEQAAQADLEYYRSLTPQQRVDIALELMENLGEEGGAGADRFERDYRIVKFSPPAGPVNDLP